MRERLIELLDKVQYQGNSSQTGQNYIQNNQIADYLLENGVVVLPYKIGDTVYAVTDEWIGQKFQKMIVKREIDGIIGNKINPLILVSNSPYQTYFYPAEFGKTVFLTKEEARKALERSKQ